MEIQGSNSGDEREGPSKPTGRPTSPLKPLDIPEGTNPSVPSSKEVSPLPPGHNYSPRRLASWARRTSQKTYSSTGMKKGGEASSQQGEDSPPVAAAEPSLEDSPSRKKKSPLGVKRVRIMTGLLRQQKLFGAGSSSSQQGKSGTTPKPQASTLAAGTSSAPKEKDQNPSTRDTPPMSISTTPSPVVTTAATTPVAAPVTPVAAAASTTPVSQATPAEATPEPVVTPRRATTPSSHGGPPVGLSVRTRRPSQPAVRFSRQEWPQDPHEEGELSPQEAAATAAALELSLQQARAANSPTAAVPVEVAEAAALAASQHADSPGESESSVQTAVRGMRLSSPDRGGVTPRSRPNPRWGVYASEERGKALRSTIAVRRSPPSSGRMGEDVSGSGRRSRRTMTAPDYTFWEQSLGYDEGDSTPKEAEEGGEEAVAAAAAGAGQEVRRMPSWVKKPSWARRNRSAGSSGELKDWAQKSGRRKSHGSAERWGLAEPSVDSGAVAGGPAPESPLAHGSKERWNSQEDQQNVEAEVVTATGAAEATSTPRRRTVSMGSAAEFETPVPGPGVGTGWERQWRQGTTSRAIPQADLVVAGGGPPPVVVDIAGTPRPGVTQPGPEEEDDEVLRDMELGRRPSPLAANPAAATEPAEKVGIVLTPPPGRKRADSDDGKGLFDNISSDEDVARGRVHAGMMMGKSDMLYTLDQEPHGMLAMLFGIQHYLFMIGSVIAIPLLTVPLMGGTPDDAAKVVSTTMLVVGASTLLQSLFGTRLPLLQGPTLSYLAAVVAISSKFKGNDASTRFKSSITEVQGAFLLTSVVKIVFAYSGGMKYIQEIINPVVVVSTITAMGFGYFAYAFPLVGACVEIGIVELILLVILAVHLREYKFFQIRIFPIYAVTVAVTVTWLFALILTSAGAYDYKGCTIDSTNAECVRPVYTMKNCRTDTTTVVQDSLWFRVPYPFQWGWPTFSGESLIVMIMGSMIATLDSTNTYHMTSFLVSARRPTIGVVGRGIGMEGVGTFIAAVFGSCNGAATLTDNFCAIETTRIGNRLVIQFGAALLVFLSVLGKVGAILAAIPQVLVGAFFCVFLAIVAMQGLSAIRFGDLIMTSNRNFTIIAFSVLMSLSVPAYFQAYESNSNRGPFRGASPQVNFMLNTVFSTNIYIAFLASVLLDFTVPGTRDERGLFAWSHQKPGENVPIIVGRDYLLPWGLDHSFEWFSWLE